MMWCLMDFLAFMHSKGIMHRDLKPENILMSSKDKDATIRVVDFGTADFCAPHQRLFDKFGTVLYVAPEVGLVPCHMFWSANSAAAAWDYITVAKSHSAVDLLVCCHQPCCMSC